MATEYAKGQGAINSTYFDFFAITHKGRCIVPDEDQSSGRMELVHNEPGSIDYSRYVMEVDCLDVIGADGALRGRVVEREYAAPTDPLSGAEWVVFVIFDGNDTQEPDGFQYGYGPTQDVVTCEASYRGAASSPISEGEIKIRDDIAG